MKIEAVVWYEDLQHEKTPLRHTTTITSRTSFINIRHYHLWWTATTIALVIICNERALHQLLATIKKTTSDNLWHSHKKFLMACREKNLGRQCLRVNKYLRLREFHYVCRVKINLIFLFSFLFPSHSDYCIANAIHNTFDLEKNCKEISYL